MFCFIYKFRSFSLREVFFYVNQQNTTRLVEVFPARSGDPSCWMWILFMINVELFPVDNFLTDQSTEYVELFSVDSFPEEPMS